MKRDKQRRVPATTRISRRTLLKSAVAGAVGLAAACGDEETAPPADETPTPPPANSTAVRATPVSKFNGAAAANAIIVVMDTFRADHVGAYGNEWIQTPSLDALAKESALFTHAFPESLPTLPMRRALHTGLRTWPFREWTPDKGDWVLIRGWQRIPEEQVTIPETLLNEGFETGFVTDTHHYFKPSKNFHRGFKQFRWLRGQESDPWHSTLNLNPQEVASHIPSGLTGAAAVVPQVIMTQHLANQGDRKTEEDYQAPRVFGEAMSWLEENQKAERFFLLVDAFDPHEPWDPPQNYLDLYADPDYDGPAVIQPVYGERDYLTDAELDDMHAHYSAELTMVDHWLGRFIDRARDLGMLDNTVLIVTSDHGHQLGEHGLTGKVHWGLWYELMDVPLFVRWPDGTAAGTRVDSFVQHQDIAPTVLSSLGVEHSVPLPGLDLGEVAGDRVPPRDHVTAGAHDYSWCRDGRYVYITRNNDTKPQLFDMEADPLQEHDIAAEEQGAVAAMHEKLLADAGGPLPM
jgi:arylsulfatase A-like enzyme